MLLSYISLLSCWCALSYQQLSALTGCWVRMLIRHWHLKALALPVPAVGHALAWVFAEELAPVQHDRGSKTRVVRFKLKPRVQRCAL